MRVQVFVGAMARLAERCGSQGEVVAIAIDRLYRQESGEIEPRAREK